MKIETNNTMIALVTKKMRMWTTTKLLEKFCLSGNKPAPIR